MSDHSLSCYIEAPTPQTLNLKADLHADFYEIGGTTPTNIIKCNQAAQVKVKIDFGGSDLARALCLKWCVKLAFEGCGQAPEGSLDVKWVEQKVCEKSCVEATIDIPANYFPCVAANCGDVYLICLTVVGFDSCGKPIPYAGYCKGGSIMVFPA